MRMFLQPRNLVIAAMLGATSWATHSARAEEETAIVPQGTLTDRIFADPRLCLDLDAPAEQFFREVSDHDPLQPKAETVSLRPLSQESTAGSNGKTQRTMRQLLDEPSCNIAAIEAERLFGRARSTQALDQLPTVKHVRVDGVIVYARTSGDRDANDSMTTRLRRAASRDAVHHGIGLPD